MESALDGVYEPWAHRKATAQHPHGHPMEVVRLFREKHDGVRPREESMSRDVTGETQLINANRATFASGSDDLDQVGIVWSGAERRDNVCFHAKVDDRGADGHIGCKIRESRETVRTTPLNDTVAWRQSKWMGRRVA